MLLLRVARFVAIFLIVTFMTTVLLELIPGSPGSAIAGETATAEQVELINETYGFNDPLVVRYGRWLGDVVTGDLGSFNFGDVKVVDAIEQRLPVTIELAVMSGLLAILIAVPLALVSAYYAGRPIDRAITGVMSAVGSIPAFGLALLLVFFLAVQIRVFPVLGWVRIEDGLGENLRAAFLPALSLAGFEAVVMQRVLRSDLIATLQQDFITLARSKGLPKWRIVLRHALRPSSFSLVTLSGLQLGRMLGGTVIVEQVFALPGLGSLLVSSIQGKEIVAVQGIVTFIAVVYLMSNFAVDLLYAFLDPRIRRAHA